MKKKIFKTLITVITCFGYLILNACGSNEEQQETESSLKTIWAKSVSSTDEDSNFKAVATDKDGSVYVVGLIDGNGFYHLIRPDSTPRQHDFGNGVIITGDNSNINNAIIIKYNSEGLAQWAKIVKGENNSEFNHLKIGNDGFIYVVGTVENNVVYDFGNGITINGAVASERNAVIVKYNSLGETQWAKSVESANYQSSFNKLAIDSNNSIYVVGSIMHHDPYNFGNGVIVSGAAAQGPYNSSGIIVKYSSAGLPLWAKSISTSNNNSVFNSVVVAQDSSIFATGLACGIGQYDFINGITVSNEYQSCSALIVKYTNDGNALSANIVKGNLSSYFEDIVLANNDSIYIAGRLTLGAKYDFGNNINLDLGSSGNSNVMTLVKYNTSLITQILKSVNNNYGTAYYGISKSPDEKNYYIVGSMGASIDLGNNIIINGNQNDNLLIVKFDSLDTPIAAKSVYSSSVKSTFNKVATATDGSVYAVGFIEGNSDVNLYNDVVVKGSCPNCSNGLIVKYSK